MLHIIPDHNLQIKSVKMLLKQVFHIMDDRIICVIRVV